MPNPIDISGQRYERLVAIRVVSTSRKGRVWLFRCDCGSETTCRASEVRSGHTSSCGCLQKEHATEQIKRARVKATAKSLANGHGHSRRNRMSVEYSTWRTMRQRCLNPNGKKYAIYGGRGIAVCDRWQRFQLFLEDMGTKPSPKHSLERVDNNGPYSPANCIWALPTVQANNRRTNRILRIGEDELTLAQASKKYGVSYNALRCRLRRGWTITEAVGLCPR